MLCDLGFLQEERRLWGCPAGTLHLLPQLLKGRRPWLRDSRSFPVPWGWACVHHSSLLTSASRHLITPASASHPPTTDDYVCACPWVVSSEVGVDPILPLHEGLQRGHDETCPDFLIPSELESSVH